MSSLLNCCNPCAETETVNVPGTEGDPGIDGVDGINAFTTTVDAILLPAGDADVGPITVASAVWMVVGQVVIVGDGATSVGETGWGHFRVKTIHSATSVTLTYLDYTGDKGTGENLLAGCTLSPAGVIGPVGP